MNFDNYIFHMPLKVRDYELDAEGIVNNANYLHYMEYTRHEFCEQAGVSFKAMLDEGIVPVVRKIEIEYLSSLRSTDVAESCIRYERKGAKFIFYQDIFRGEELIARGIVTIVSIENGRLSRGERLAQYFKEYER